MEIVIEDLCRLCLREGGEVEHLFSIRNDRLIVNQVRNFFPALSIEEFDDLPKFICTDCLEIISKVDELREKSLDSEDYLKSILQEAENFELVEQEDCNIDQELSIEKICELEKPPETKLVKSTKPARAKDAVECYICNIVLSRKSLSRHMKTVHDLLNFKKKEYEAEKFAVQTVNEETLTPKPKSCKWCSQKFQNTSSLKLHQITDHFIEEQKTKSLQPVGCSFCASRFSSISTMKLHLKKVHNLDPNLLIYYCNHCSFSANDKTGLEIHIKETHFGIDGKPHACNVCGTRFIHQRNLRTHLITKHQIADKDTFLCGDCDFHSTRKSKSNCGPQRVANLINFRF